MAAQQQSTRAQINQALRSASVAVPQLRAALAGSDFAEKIHGGSSIGRALINPVGFLTGGGKVHGLDIAPDVKKFQKRLAATDRATVEAAVANFTSRLGNWGNCRGRGSGCVPHRDGSLAVARAAGLAVAAQCVNGAPGRAFAAACAAAQAPLNAAFLARRFSPPPSSPTSTSMTQQQALQLLLLRLLMGGVR